MNKNKLKNNEMTAEQSWKKKGSKNEISRYRNPISRGTVTQLLTLCSSMSLQLEPNQDVDKTQEPYDP